VVHRQTAAVFAIAGWLTFALSAFAQQQELDLRGAISAAQTANLELRAARQQRALALAGLTTARQLPNPVLGFTAARDTPHEGVSLDIPIEIGGQRGKRMAVAREEQKATEIDIDALARNIRRRTREAFFESLSAREQSAQAKAALDLSTRVRDLTQHRFDAGDVAEIEVRQAEVEVARSSADYETTVQAQRSSDVALAALLNRSFENPLAIQGKLEDIPTPPTLTTATDQAMQSSGDLVKTTQDLKIEERQLDLAKAQRIPNLDLSAGADFNSPGEFQVGGKGGIAVTLPIFYHGQGEVALSKARLELLRLTLSSQRLGVSAQVAAAYFDYQAKLRQVQEYRDRVLPQTVRLEQMAEESYQAGKSNLLILLDAQRRLNEIRKIYLDALLSAQTSFAALEEVVGVPLD
jgi:cobalt-zinc-cadmium efflux system outer membrane protein